MTEIIEQLVEDRIEKEISDLAAQKNNSNEYSVDVALKDGWCIINVLSDKKLYSHEIHDIVRKYSKTVVIRYRQRKWTTSPKTQ